MRVVYDKNINVAGVAVTPWDRLGPEMWLPNYTVISPNSWDMPSGHGPRLVTFPEDSVHSNVPANTAALLRYPDFQQLLQRELPGYDLLLYKPVKIRDDLKDVLAGRKILAVDASFRDRVENKAEFRRAFSDIVRFPPYRVINRSQLQKTPAYFEDLRAIGPKLVLQDEQFNGGRGSFIVNDFQQYQAALEVLERLSRHSRVVVSAMVKDAQELSIQCCVTRQGVFIGPLQRQVINHPALVGVTAGSNLFCGVQLATDDQGTELSGEARSAARLIGERLQIMGYQGIFGVDFLAGKDGTLYVLEVNPRITGATPLVTGLYDDDAGIPFYLLHILELGGYSYEVDTHSQDFRREGSLLWLHSQEMTDKQIVDIPASGTYRCYEGRLQRTGNGVSLRGLDKDSFVVLRYGRPGMTGKAGGRLAMVLLSKPVLSADGIGMRSDALEIVQAVRQSITMKSIES